MPEDHAGTLFGVPGDAERALSALLTGTFTTHAAPSPASSATTGHQLFGFSFDYTTDPTFDLDSTFQLQDGALDLAVPASSALDFNAVPFDYSTSTFPFFPSPALSAAPPSSSVEGATAASALDQSLESPLGLESGLYADFLVSPMFSEASDTVPELDYAFPSLFPTSSAPTAFETALRPNPPPPKRPSCSPSTTSSSSSLSSCSTPASAKRPTKALPKPNGFRADATKTPLLPIDAPIEPRAYLLPSTTSRKRKTTAAEREIAKRLALAEATAAPEPDIPQDLVAAVEKKRLLNTLCARKSRQRKQERLGELELENSALVDENDALKMRVAELEALLKNLGAQF